MQTGAQRSGEWVGPGDTGTWCRWGGREKRDKRGAGRGSDLLIHIQLQRSQMEEEQTSTFTSVLLRSDLRGRLETREPRVHVSVHVFQGRAQICTRGEPGRRSWDQLREICGENRCSSGSLCLVKRENPETREPGILWPRGRCCPTTIPESGSTRETTDSKTSLIAQLLQLIWIRSNRAI